MKQGIIEKKYRRRGQTIWIRYRGSPLRFVSRLRGNDFVFYIPTTEFGTVTRSQNFMTKTQNDMVLNDDRCNITKGGCLFLVSRENRNSEKRYFAYDRYPS